MNESKSNVNNIEMSQSTANSSTLAAHIPVYTSDS